VKNSEEWEGSNFALEQVAAVLQGLEDVIAAAGCPKTPIGGSACEAIKSVSVIAVVVARLIIETVSQKSGTFYFFSLFRSTHNISNYHLIITDRCYLHFCIRYSCGAWKCRAHRDLREHR
jgi:hypothetical protein